MRRGIGVSRGEGTLEVIMENIVKLCSSCDEGFPEKFNSCPNCGAGLQTFRLEAVDECGPVVSDLLEARMADMPAPVGGYCPTMIVEKNGATRNVLFAGAL